ncbi:hypothetical protein [Sporosalibacterium faouarense]|uniref:hypothetical protein n=1 Tax=Sporosalibacterium faouarense TaxID=516123 RepID=UPI00192CD6C4|nr:hypothetical protein [Sporosalibacterium faouarense]
MTQDMIALIIIIPLFTIFMVFIIAKPKIILNLQKKIYMKLFDVEINYSNKTEKIFRGIGICIALFSLLAAYMQLMN